MTPTTDAAVFHLSQAAALVQYLDAGRVSDEFRSTASGIIQMHTQEGLRLLTTPESSFVGSNDNRVYDAATVDAFVEPVLVLLAHYATVTR